MNTIKEVLRLKYLNNLSNRKVEHKLFIDFSGLTMPIVNAKTKEIKKAQIFVSVLGASGYTFVHAFEKWNPGRILNWALSIGVNTVELMKKIMQSKTHTVRGYKSCIVILSFSKSYGNEALELTCKRALELNIQSVSSIEAILKRRSYLFEENLDFVNNDLFNNHSNIRGASEYS